MKTTKLFSIILFGIICASPHCNDDNQGHGDTRLTIINNSNETIASFLQYNYPDTSIQDRETPGFNAIAIEPHSKNNHLTFIDWEILIPRNNPYNTIFIFIYSSDTIQRYTWSHIQQNYSVLRRYDLTIAQLKAINWTITFP